MEKFMTLRLHFAEGLDSTDAITGASDPVVKVFVNEKEAGISHTVAATCTPVWDENVSLVGLHGDGEDMVRLEVLTLNKSALSRAKYDFLGCVVFEGAELLRILEADAPQVVKHTLAKFPTKSKHHKDKHVQGDITLSFEEKADEEYDPTRDAQDLNDALLGFGCEPDVLVAILASKTGEEVQQLREKYKEMFNSDLKDEIKSETRGSFGDFLSQLVEGDRDEDAPVDLELADKQAKQLYDAGEKRWGTNEKVFIEIFASVSAAQLKAISEAYGNYGKMTLDEAIEDELSGTFKHLIFTANMKAHERAEVAEAKSRREERRREREAEQAERDAAEAEKRAAEAAAEEAAREAEAEAARLAVEEAQKKAEEDQSAAAAAELAKAVEQARLAEIEAEKAEAEATARREAAEEAEAASAKAEEARIVAQARSQKCRRKLKGVFRIPMLSFVAKTEELKGKKKLKATVNQMNFSTFLASTMAPKVEEPPPKPKPKPKPIEYTPLPTPVIHDLRPEPEPEPEPLPAMITRGSGLDRPYNRLAEAAAWRLREAAECANEGAVKAELEKPGVDPNEGGKANLTALHKAAAKGHVRVIELLLQKGANTEAQTRRTMDTPLHMACSGGHTNAARALVACGADLNAVNKMGWTPLHVALTKRHTKLSDALVQMGADANRESSAGIAAHEVGDVNCSLRGTWSPRMREVVKRAGSRVSTPLKEESLTARLKTMHHEAPRSRFTPMARTVAKQSLRDTRRSDLRTFAGMDRTHTEDMWRPTRLDRQRKEDQAKESAAHAEEDITALFEDMDLDGSGTLDREEISRMSRILGHPMSEAQLDDAMAQMDDDNSGEVDFAEFHEWWGSLKKSAVDLSDKGDGVSLNTMLRYGTQHGASLLLHS